MEQNLDPRQKLNPGCENRPDRELWEKPTVSELGSLAKDTEGEFNFLNDGNQLT